MSSYIPKCHHMQFNGSMQIILNITVFPLKKKKKQKRNSEGMFAFQPLYS